MPGLLDLLKGSVSFSCINIYEENLVSGKIVSVLAIEACFCCISINKEMNGVLGRDSALLRLCWAEDNLG